MVLSTRYQRQGSFYYSIQETGGGFYYDPGLLVLWGYENPQDPICYSSRTGFVATFSNFPLLFFQNYIQIFITLLYIMNVWYCLTLLGNYFLWKLLSRKWSTTWEFVVGSWSFSSSNIYEENNGVIVLSKIPRMTPKSKHIAARFH